MKSKNIRPIPKWRFVTKKILTGLAVVLAVLLGGLAFSIILFSIQQLGFDLLTHMLHSRVEFLLGLLPFLWIGALLIFLILGMVSIKNSGKGYKFSPSKLLIYNSAFSILLGILFFISGGAQWFEHIFEVNVSSYQSVQEKKIQMWSMPKDGYLSGRIENLNKKIFILRDFSKNKWEVDYSSADKPTFLELEEDMEIKIIGEATGPGTFRADEIKPWGGNRRFGNRNGQRDN
ncbi:MAG: hypothetical protein KDC05_09360 [Bacteroidales bacterium]|nr:hypothetical protein [Bacteroidales bacterium]